MSSPQKRAKQPKIPEFINKLADMIQKYPKFISWDLDGQHLLIFNSHLLESELLSKYFRHSNLSSFVRQVIRRGIQLNIYGFRKMDQDLTYIKFQHQIFKRGQQTEYWRIRRKANQFKQKQGVKEPIQGKMEQIKELQKLEAAPEIISFISQEYRKKNKLESIYEQLEKDFACIYQFLSFQSQEMDSASHDQHQDEIYESSQISNSQIHYFRAEYQQKFTKIYQQAADIDRLLKKLSNQAYQQANEIIVSDGFLSEVNLEISEIELNIKNIDEDNSIFNFENCQN